MSPAEQAEAFFDLFCEQWPAFWKTRTSAQRGHNPETHFRDHLKTRTEMCCGEVRVACDVRFPETRDCADYALLPEDGSGETDLVATFAVKLVTRPDLWVDLHRAGDKAKWLRALAENARKQCKRAQALPQAGHYILLAAPFPDPSADPTVAAHMLRRKLTDYLGLRFDNLVLRRMDLLWEAEPDLMVAMFEAQPH